MSDMEMLYIADIIRPEAIFDGYCTSKEDMCAELGFDASPMRMFVCWAREGTFLALSDDDHLGLDEAAARMAGAFSLGEEAFAAKGIIADAFVSNEHRDLPLSKRFENLDTEVHECILGVFRNEGSGDLRVVMRQYSRSDCGMPDWAPGATTILDEGSKLYGHYSKMLR